MQAPLDLLTSRDQDDNLIVWDTQRFHELLNDGQDDSSTLRTTERLLESSAMLPEAVAPGALHDEFARPFKQTIVSRIDASAQKKRVTTYVVQRKAIDDTHHLIMLNDRRGTRQWCLVDQASGPQSLQLALAAVTSTLTSKNKRPVLIWPHGEITADCRVLVEQAGSHTIELENGASIELATFAAQGIEPPEFPAARSVPRHAGKLTHLDRLEAEGMHIIREVAAQADNPVMLYSIGKDSAVMLHLARKAFYPSPPPFPLLHVDTRWKFQDMYRFRERMAKVSGMDLIVHINPEGVEKDVNPFDHGSALHTDIMKTQGLKQALDAHKFDAAFGGARRDEEKSRAKERVFSFRTKAHRWDPKNQRPELWRLYNGYKSPGESMRVFPLSNWTELDIWQYIYREQIPMVPLYFAAERPVVERDGALIMVDDDRMRLHEGEQIEIKRVRFRTLGCYPLTGAVESDATDLESIVLELLEARTSERQGRVIDSDSNASMEQKKQEGYF